MPSYNCECEESSGYKTLAELRTALLARLGFADPLGSAEHRTLDAMRRDLLARLGYAAQIAFPPPGVLDLVDSLINEAEQTLWRRLELDKGDGALPPRLVEPTDETTLDAPMVFALALAAGKAHYGQNDARSYGETVERMLADHVQRRPPNVMAILTSLLQDAQESLYRRYNVLRTERIYRWPLQAGVKLYDLDGNADDCPRKLDPRKVSWVGVERDGVWYPLECGIRPELYSFDQQGWPSRYEIRQCIEVWPTPEDDEGVLRIKGHFGLEPFTEDEHRTTIDDQPVFLLALANAKEHYRQPDGQNYISQLETLIAGLVAGSHQTRRYVPGAGRRLERNAYAIPKPSEPFN